MDVAGIRRCSLRYGRFPRGPGASAGVSVPALRTGRRVLGVAAVSVYGAAVVAYTLLPLPDSRGSWCPAPGLSPQWRPLSFVSDIAEASSGSGTLGC